MTITLTIGLNSNMTLAPLPITARRRFVSSVRSLLGRSGGTVYVDGATSRGTWQDIATGLTVAETSRTWVADVPDPDSIRNALPLLAATFEQDAIALTTGETALVA